MHFAPKRRNFRTLWSVFIYCCEPKMGVIFFKEKCKTIVNSKKWRKNLALIPSLTGKIIFHKFSRCFV